MRNSYSCPELICGTLKIVKGQSKAKRVISAVLFEHLKKMIDSLNNEPVKYKSSNITLVGPSGCGKTLLVETASKAVGLPFHFINAPKLGPFNCTGKYTLETALEEYYKKNRDNYYHDQLTHGVIFIDEVDKLGCMTAGSNTTWGTQIQDSILKLIEGAELTVDGTTYNTANLLFVFAGAFTGIEKHIENRLSKENLKSTSIGFVRKTSGQSKDVTDTKDLREKIVLEDLVSYNLKTEFVGRMGVLIPMESINENTTREIIKEIVNKGFPYFKNEGVQLHFTEESIDAITNKCMKQTFGYRGINTFFDYLLFDPKYDIGKLSGKAMSITGKIVDEGFPKNYFDNLTPTSSQTKEVQDHKEKADGVNPSIENEKYDTISGIIHSVYSPTPNIDNANYLDIEIETTTPDNPNKEILFPVTIVSKKLIIDFTEKFLGDHTEDLSSDFPDIPNQRYVIKEENSNRRIIKMDKKMNIKMNVRYQEYKTEPDKFLVHEFDEIQDSDTLGTNLPGDFPFMDEKDEKGTNLPGDFPFMDEKDEKGTNPPEDLPFMDEKDEKGTNPPEDVLFKDEGDEIGTNPPEDILFKDEGDEIGINLNSGNILILNEKDENGFYKWLYLQRQNHQSIP